MTKINGAEKPCYWARTLMAALCFVGFSITMPPLGLLMFLGFTGVIDNRTGSSFTESITPVQDLLMPTLIILFGILSVYMVTTRKIIIFRCLAITLVLLATTSLGGCVMGLSNLKNIGS